MNNDPLTAEDTVNDWTIDTSKPDGIRVIDSKGNVRGRYADMRQLALYGVLTMQEADQLRATLAERERELAAWRQAVDEAEASANRTRLIDDEQQDRISSTLGFSLNGAMLTSLGTIHGIRHKQAKLAEYLLSRAVGSGEGTSQEGEKDA